ncbi:hypothetical protein BBO99_00008557 [Phytophthora kernoviae]|uniref:Uncharacterized protein n=2 Tax=Phytophthora kernoviae TaxID=325452 RepID=A0A3R7GTW8_9STRA|nr:hypothetical protein G195_010796 [Phytophthora kernoviae 00238/432]KAG2510453.1 hypothetical protein JM16_008289 [Phytophthora kernoviae]KAG2520048.1 hypothetical protein JM18_007328 [Phytophthora kernoviae]RLN10057.1 hypothetical protein BBI17_008502 [Phytophthora kernoviae]RLN75079.1 hypothetical protein BBO99_00008557 [Phytophthora kernoviae]
MVGNKHKNGIICTYPGCSKTMRTQKFKLHFTKAHLKQGEVYSVEHRREYEVAREDNSGGGEADTRTVVKHETLEGVAVITSVAAGTEPMMNPTSVGVETLGAAMLPSSVATEHSDSQTTQQRHLTDPQQLLVPSQYEAQVSHDMNSTGAGSASANVPPQVSIQHAATEQSASNKRPSSAMDAETADPSSSLLVEFVAMMDQRFQELVGKMGEMIEVQKQLIDALQTKNPGVLGDQAPALALASAAEVVMKRHGWKVTV